MRTLLTVLLTASTLAGGLLTGTALYAQGADDRSAVSNSSGMMGSGENDRSGMMGHDGMMGQGGMGQGGMMDQNMMKQMSRMMENCNKMMESAMAEPRQKDGQSPDEHMVPGR